MTAPIWLIGGREFRTYVATASFWIALAFGPLAAGAALLAAGGHDVAQPVQIRTASPVLLSAAIAAVEQAASLEGRHLAAGRKGASLSFSKGRNGIVLARFDANFPLSAAGRALAISNLERDAARKLVRSAPLTIRTAVTKGRSSTPDAAQIGRFSMMMLLWLTLTGSLGMLLQSVVRERASRALESLLAAARPAEIMLGKLAGVGAVSLLVLLTLLASVMGYSVLLPSGGSTMSSVLGGLASPAALARTVLIYVLAYAFYGSVTIGLGAIARDVSAAQNLSRPMFVVLLVAFFIALAATASGSEHGLSWLLYVPPFAPFMLLLRAPSEFSIVSQILSLGLLSVAALSAGLFAVGRFSLLETKPRRNWFGSLAVTNAIFK